MELGRRPAEIISILSMNWDLKSRAIAPTSFSLIKNRSPTLPSLPCEKFIFTQISIELKWHFLTEQRCFDHGSKMTFGFRILTFNMFASPFWAKKLERLVVSLYNDTIVKAHRMFSYQNIVCRSIVFNNRLKRKNYKKLSLIMPRF